MKARLAGLLILLAGCEFTTAFPDPSPAPPPVALADRFDPAVCGDVTGDVYWVGDQFRFDPQTEWRLTPEGSKAVRIPNPNAPTVTAGNTIAGVVVRLEGIDPGRARPWDKPPARVTANADGVFVNGGRNGFVRRGEPVTITSAGDEPLGVRGRGAAFFTAMLPDRATTTRTFDRPGRVELTSAANLHWAVADLFVCDHPYYAITDAAGRFEFTQVPPGDYELVARVPNWRIVGHDRDPETGAVSRLRYAPAVEVRTAVIVTRGNTPDVRLNVPVTAFFAR